MLSYQHAYHAGGPADLHKHIVLAELLAQLTRKPRGITYAETHAGRGLYDLAAPEALKTGEAAAGIARLAPDPATPFGRALAAVRAAHGPTAYPGSPLLARSLLRAQDRLLLAELHPAEHAALRATLAGPGVAIHRRDGFEALLALAPPTPRRGLVLVDPSYELKSDFEATAAFVRRLIAKWPEADRPRLVPAAARRPPPRPPRRPRPPRATLRRGRLRHPARARHDRLRPRPRQRPARRRRRLRRRPRPGRPGARRRARLARRSARHCSSSPSPRRNRKDFIQVS